MADNEKNSTKIMQEKFADKEMNKEVVAAWKKVGVDAYINPVDINQYSINGKQVSQGEAYRHAQKVLNKYVKDSDWMPKK